MTTPATPRHRARTLRFVGATTVVITALALGGQPPSAGGASSAAPSPRAPFADPVPDDMALVSQTFNLDADGELDITIALPSGVDASELDADARIVITSYRVVSDRQAFLEAIDGTLPRVEDTFDIPLDPAVAGTLASMPTTDTLMLRIPTESVERTDGALQMASVGVHPLVIELRIGIRRYSTSTFVNRLPDPSTGDGRAMSIGLIMGQTTTPTIDTDGTVRAGPDEVAELVRLADALLAIDAAPARVGLDPSNVPPRAVGVDPSTLEAVAIAEPDLANRLAPSVAAGDVIARPRLPLDAGAAAALTATGAAEPLYTRWLREGEDLLDQLLP
ncbi:MAG: hypothetical protein WD023_04225, partial [Ilumatobacteraceae bacterium]